MNDPIEQIFREVAEMTPKLVDEDPLQSEEYQRFVASMVEHCHCCERNRPCDGVLAGGPCDGVEDKDFEGSEDDDEP